MKTYKFKLSKAAVILTIAGILLGLGAIGFTVWRIYRTGFSEPLYIIQHVVLLLVGTIAIVIFASILIRSVYKINDKELILWFGFIKSVYSIQEMESIHLFTKSNKLVIYFKDERYTVIVVKPDWFNEFTKDLCSRNSKIRYDVSTTEIDDKPDDF